MWFTQKMGYIHTEISSPFITVQKDEGIQPAATSLHFLFTLSQTLSNNRRYCLQCYNTIHNHFKMLSFIGEIPWENTTVNPIPWVHKVRERVYSTFGVQTRLNNISGSGRSGSINNNNFILTMLAGMDGE